MYCNSSLITAYPRVAPLSDTLYSSAAAYSATGQGYMPHFATESSAFYSPLSNTDNADAWRTLSQSTGQGWAYDPSMTAYAYGPSYGSLDVRRKNATRESTSTLKAWLYEHIKNPYPTKGEKIMLAIITKMTLTQVSTWFANARRRLKKENKMQWSPRNRTDNEDDKSSCSDIDDNNSNKESHQPVKAGDRDTINDDTVNADTILSNSTCILMNRPTYRHTSEDLHGTQLISSNEGQMGGANRGQQQFTPTYASARSLGSASLSLGSSSTRVSLDARAQYYNLVMENSKPGGVVQPHSSEFCDQSLSDLASPSELERSGSASKPRIWSLADVATSRNSNDSTANHVMRLMTPSNLMSCVNHGFQPWTDGLGEGGQSSSSLQSTITTHPFNTGTRNNLYSSVPGDNQSSGSVRARMSITGDLPKPRQFNQSGFTHWGTGHDSVLDTEYPNKMASDCNPASSALDRLSYQSLYTDNSTLDAQQVFKSFPSKIRS